MMDIYSLDIETRALTEDKNNTFALEPWRLRQGQAEISSVAVCRPDDSVIQIINDKAKHRWNKEVSDLLKSLKGQRVFAHFAGFDVAWLIATLQPHKFKAIPSEVSNILWADTVLLTKWLVNGQRAEESKFSYSLANLVETFLPDHPKTPEFLELKTMVVQPGSKDGYWETRGQLDVVMTRALAEYLMPMVPESMRVGLMTEWSCIVPVANGWVNGIKIDENHIEEVEDLLRAKMDRSTAILEINGSVISSPKQLGNLLFNDWGLTPWSYTPTKQPSTAGDDIMHIAYELRAQDSVMADKLDLVRAYKENKTLHSKYISTLKAALEYTGDGYIYGTPKLFGTYTSRMTYSNTTVKDGPKTSIALHQLPRIKSETKNADVVRKIRSLLIAPDGFGVIEVDASGQESRLMAIRANDLMMLEIFKRGLNFHSMTAAAIIGMDYHEFMKNYEAEKSGYYMEQRQLGKLTNLSCNYRIGGPALSEKAFTEYDTFMTPETGRFLVSTFSRQYSGVPLYWSEVIKSAKELGYTECYGGKRYKLHRWGESDRWMTESSAINFPIQGSGASMKEIAISVSAKELPNTLFALDLHDATFSYAPLEGIKETAEDLVNLLEDINYKAFWGFDPPISLPYESATGLNFGEVK